MRKLARMLLQLSWVLYAPIDSYTCTCTVRVLYYPTRLEELQTWLLDEDACQTEWQTLLDLRARHAPHHAQ